MFDFDPKKVDYRNAIGSGSYGTVYPYKEDKNDPKGDRWVVKQIEASTYHIDNVLMSIQEIVLGFRCRHPNVLSVQSYHMSFNKANLHWTITLKLPRMEQSLFAYMQKQQKNGPFTQNRIIKIFHGIVSGLEYLHSENIAHRDIKPENILVKENNVKLADFGVVAFIDGNTSKVVQNYAGTEEFKAPEVANLEEFENRGLYKADMWSVGIVMAKVCLGATAEPTTKDKVTYIVDRESFYASKLSGLEGTYDKRLLELIKNLIKNEPDTRTTAKDVRRALEFFFADVLEAPEEQTPQGKDESKGTEVERVKPGPQTNSLTAATASSTMFQQDTSKTFQEPTPKGLVEKDNQLIEVIEERKTEESMSGSQIDKIEAIEELKEMRKYMKGCFNKEFTFEVSKNPVRFVINSKNPEKINNTTMTKLISELKGYKNGETYRNLEGISLILLYCNEGMGRGIKQFVTEICENCSRLTFLELSFWGSKENINDTLMENISTPISKYLKGLEHLVLFFNECDKITADGISCITQDIIPNLSRLKTLKLNLNACNQISNESIKELCTKISQKLPVLETLHLFLQECTNVSDDTVFGLGAQFSTLKGLKNLFLSLASCTKVTNNAILDLCKKIGQNLKGLKSIEVAFYG